ncbi:MAG: thioredoxin domain-containing protein [Acidobacteria bacterium]|nr:thioredoxin domain-containing protein [Acidobacteriota bacterium]
MSTAPLNRLGQASSAYLRSASHQPIRWFEWGEAAFTAAREQNKPILLDVGAVWCHWCHVMDRESYENPELAEIVNQLFVPVKVDRDERPDVDSRYQAAVQAISGQGGWPLTVFLTPDGKPFFGGTYFPPEEHWGRPGFKRVLLSIGQAYRDRHGEVVESADAVMAAMAHAESFAGRSASFSPRIVEEITDAALKMFDAQNGGFGSAPKFPHPAMVDLLLYTSALTGNQRARECAAFTLKKMAAGGVYDQLGGGFHRYSVDERWVVPHFEKMSYDNSELLKNSVHAFQATADPAFRDLACDIMRWIDSWLSDREHGGFYSSQDADYSLHDDGDYFTWTLDEARAVLNPDELRVASLYYDIGEVGEMHHDPARNVLYIRAEVPEITVRLGMAPGQVQALLDSAKQRMYAARLKRPTPYVDKTMYVNWNALCISAYLQAGRVLQLEAAKRFGLRSLDRILAQAWRAQSGELDHVIAYSEIEGPRTPPAGMLDDYAFTAIACLDAWEATADISYFNFARAISGRMLQRFFDAAGGAFFDAEPSNSSLGALVTRRKPFQDSPTPSGNSAAAILLLRLHALTNEARYREAAESTLEAFAGVAGQFGIFAATYGLAVQVATCPHESVCVIGNDELARRLYAAALAPLAINRSVLCFSPSQVVTPMLPPVLAETLPLLPALKSNRSFAVVCSGSTCRPPVSTPEELLSAGKH